MTEQEVFFNILDLLETMNEGIEYVEGKLETLDIEATIPILVDIIDAFSAIESTIEPLFSEGKNSSLEDKTKTLRDSFDKMVNEYEQDGQKILTIINSIIKPEFKDWKEEIELALRPYIVS